MQTHDKVGTRSFAAALDSGHFLVTTEEPLPKGADLSVFSRRLELLEGVVDAVNLTDASAAVMTMSPVGAVPPMLSVGLHPILPITCRDRNRIALQADLLGAAALGVETISCMAGDATEQGDHPGAADVFDLDTVALIEAAGTLNRGHDLHGNQLKGKPDFCCGAVVNPNATDLDAELARMECKAEAGARFFQTQAVYNETLFENFMAKVERLRVPVLAGFIVPKSAAMAQRLNAGLAEVEIPVGIIARLESSNDPAATSLELCAPILSRLAELCQGVHVIAVGWESKLPQLLAAAGISRRRLTSSA